MDLESLAASNKKPTAPAREVVPVPSVLEEEVMDEAVVAQNKAADAQQADELLRRIKAGEDLFGHPDIEHITLSDEAETKASIHQIVEYQKKQQTLEAKKRDYDQAVLLLQQLRDVVGAGPLQPTENQVVMVKQALEAAKQGFEKIPSFGQTVQRVPIQAQLVEILRAGELNEAILKFYNQSEAVNEELNVLKATLDTLQQTYPEATRLAASLQMAGKAVQRVKGVQKGLLSSDHIAATVAQMKPMPTIHPRQTEMENNGDSLSTAKKSESDI